jgi:hypothetical protein
MRFEAIHRHCNLFGWRPGEKNAFVERAGVGKNEGVFEKRCSSLDPIDN